MGEIVLGYDGSEGADLALAEACSLAKALGDKVVIVFGYAPGGYGGGEVPTHREAVEELAEKVTAEGAGKVTAAGIDNEVRLKPLKPSHALIEVASEDNARMIVVGHHSESALKSTIIGSTPHKLLHEAELPVLIVPAGK
jgi:nucleotide-binding universal stress UspA family protein